MQIELIIVISLAMAFGLMNGMRDSSNIVATMITSYAFRPRTALVITALAEFVGPFLFGVVVARTIGNDVVDAKVLTLNVMVACLVGAIAWNLITWMVGFPGSSSHALIGGLIGAVLVSAGPGAVKVYGLVKILIALFALPVVSFIFGFVITRLIYFLSRNATPRVNIIFKRGQLFTALAMALSHGANDAQKTMGIITLCLIISGSLASFSIPTWVVVSSAAGIGIGTLFGGSKMIRTIGGRFFRIRPVHSFSTQLSSSIILLTASFLGMPVSTSHVVSSAIIGVGSSERPGKVRWSVAGDILVSWLVTIPISALLSMGVYWLVGLVFGR